MISTAAQCIPDSRYRESVYRAIGTRIEGVHPVSSAIAVIPDRDRAQEAR